MRRIVRTTEGWGLADGDAAPTRLRHALADVLAGAPLVTSAEVLGGGQLAPVDGQEVWAAGVTYERSLAARTEESREPDVYERVYLAERPELFFKSVASRVVGHGGIARVREDSAWNVPEPELVLVLDAEGRVFGYTIGDDVSSRSIESENPLYLPQAKVYDGACVIGPWIVPAADVAPPFDIALRVVRAATTVFEGRTSTTAMKRSFDELASWLTREIHYPSGVLLMTGTGIVPPDDFSLASGDEVRIEVAPIGVLEHRVTTSAARHP